MIKTFHLFIYLNLTALGLHCCAWAFSSCTQWASHCGGSSCCGAWASVDGAHGLSSYSPRALECRLSDCGTQVSCPKPCGIFMDQELNLHTLNWQVDV